MEFRVLLYLPNIKVEGILFLYEDAHFLDKNIPEVAKSKLGNHNSVFKSPCLLC